ncbi:BAX INHIBITOR-RELATED [Salix koriyanagi]|uniref:BAX INHIBITOR-RELATED n=1 Tax=Salix koriyanagi TaxID=2511006 RepID=A0A9Q1AF90_9ROSI|nr:BAX INHIBITOR-RELATED [Salix koriyanagi]
MASYNKKGSDIEAGIGNHQLYPMMQEPPQLRWAFIRKVYVILAMQLLLTVGVAATVVFVRPIPQFILHTTPGLAIYIVFLTLTLILLWPLHVYSKRHPWNYFFMALFTICIAFAVGLSCALTKGRIVLEAAILTSVVVVGLTLYTFWASKRGQDFSFLGPFLFSAVLVLIVFGLIQFLFPLGKWSLMIYGGLGAIVFSGFIVYDTGNLIKRFSYDEYISAAISLYLDIINLFLALLNIFNAVDN